MATNTTSEMAKMRRSAVLTSRDRESNSLIFNSRKMSQLCRTCPIRARFGDLKRQTNLRKLNAWLSERSYLVDDVATKLDVEAHAQLDAQLVDSFPHISRWWNHIASYKREYEFLPDGKF